MSEYTLDNVGAIFTCCLFPALTCQALRSVLHHYPMLEAVVVVDGCRVGPAHVQAHGDEREVLERECQRRGVAVLRNEQRVGTGRSIDRGLRALSTPLFLTVDHGVEILEPGIVELLVDKMNADPLAVGSGRIRNDKKCNRAFGPYIDPVFAIWDRKFIVAHDDLTFALTHVRIGDWQVNGCSTAQFLQYRALCLGRMQAFISPKVLYRHVRHHRTPQTRGRCASPHELMIVDEDYLPPRLRRPQTGELLYKGDERAKQRR